MTNEKQKPNIAEEKQSSNTDVMTGTKKQKDPVIHKQRGPYELCPHCAPVEGAAKQSD